MRDNDTLHCCKEPDYMQQLQLFMTGYVLSKSLILHFGKQMESKLWIARCFDGVSFLSSYALSGGSEIK